MLITYLRSSSFNTYNVCPHQYYIQYVLGIDQVFKKSATIGTMTHKALEYFAKQKLAIQNGEDSFYDDGLDRLVKVDEVDFDFATNTAWNLYNKVESREGPWVAQDLATVYEYTEIALSYNDGEYDPRKLDIFTVEDFFDIHFDEPWSAYHYILEDGREIKGNLSIRGTCDLLLYESRDPLVVEYLDWKTGKYNTDFATGKVKDENALREDPQLMIYNYAIRQKYPQIKEMIFTLNFIRAGGPVSVIFYPEDTERCLESIKSRFLEIKNDNNPNWIKDDNPSQKWKCQYVCYFNQQKLANGKTICDHIHSLIKRKGIAWVTNKYAKLDKLNKYEGGGNTVDLRSE